jgi:hypothetical protein
MAQPTKIMLIRHAEKPAVIDNENHLGIRSDGTEDKDSLIVRGWQRAGALCTLFGPAQAGAGRGLAVPDHIYAADPEKSTESGTKSRRSKQTVSALAKLLGIQTNLDHGKGQEAAVAASVLAAGGTVVICWSHERIPEMAREIPGGDLPATRSWPDDRFDVVWVFELGTDGRYTFREVPQALLAGDRPAH